MVSSGAVSGTMQGSSAYNAMLSGDDASPRGELPAGWLSADPDAMPNESVQQLEGKVNMFNAQLEEVVDELDSFDRLHSGRRQPLVNQMEEIRARRDEAIAELEEVSNQGSVRPPGPTCLKWVDSAWFAAACNLIVAANLTCMVLSTKWRAFAAVSGPLDHFFLVWYTVELSLKYVYYRQHLFYGKVSEVWWNWLDLFIVVCGILDQWITPLAAKATGADSKGFLPINANALRSLRLLRLCRILRILKLGRTFFQGDMAWVRSPQFEVFMSAVIGLNAMTMSLELDYEWGGWVWVENTFLVIYFLELSARMKIAGCAFWVDSSNLMWNYLDFVIVAVGVLDLWLTPAIALFQMEVLGESEGVHMNSNGVASLLRLMRMFRILRLAKLVKTVPALYRLMLGVIDSLKAMQWVIVLTIFLLYGGAIFWTSLVGKGLIYQGGTVPQDVEEHFGSVSQSLFSLFLLMNGDTSSVEAVCTNMLGKLLFVGFTILANWAVLAILTSVVSDNMIAASTKVIEEEENKMRANEYKERVRRLRALFREIDVDHSGAISRQEWNDMLQDKGLLHELSDATDLTVRDFQELFNCLAVEPKKNHPPPSNFFSSDVEKIKRSASSGRLQHTDELIMHYDAFIDHLEDEFRPADKRSVLKLMSRLQTLENRIDDRFDQMWSTLSFQIGTIRDHIVGRGGG